MASDHNNSLFILMVLIITTAFASAARPLSNPPAPAPAPAPTGSSLAARLRLEGTDHEPSKCWESLFELQACSGEVMMFFLNGETYLGPGCCQAIRVVGHDCWPNVIGTLGFTSEEDDILQSYCDPDHHSPPLPPPSVEPQKELLP